MGRKGGRSTSDAKRAASRLNGAFGGRPRTAELLARRVRDAQSLLQPALPNIDPGDLGLVLSCLFRPPRHRQFFMWRDKEGRYAF